MKKMFFPIALFVGAFVALFIWLKRKEPDNGARTSLEAGSLASTANDLVNLSKAHIPVNAAQLSSVTGSYVGGHPPVRNPALSYAPTQAAVNMAGTSGTRTTTDNQYIPVVGVTLSGTSGSTSAFNDPFGARR